MIESILVGVSVGLAFGLGFYVGRRIERRRIIRIVEEFGVEYARRTGKKKAAVGSLRDVKFDDAPIFFCPSESRKR